MLVKIYSKRKVYILIMVLIASASSYGQKPVRIVQPSQPFNSKMANEMLEQGNLQITGVAYYEGRTLLGVKSDETIYAQEGAIVSLYPLTPYLQEYLELKSKDREGKQMATISPEAASYRIEVKIINSKGEFNIMGLKPGKYYLQSEVHFPSGISSQEVSEIVELTTNGEIQKCKLNKVYRGFIY